MNKNRNLSSLRLLCKVNKTSLCPFYVHFKAKNAKKYQNIETIEKDEILCFQSLNAQLLDIKQVRKTGVTNPCFPATLKHHFSQIFLAIEMVSTV